MQRIGILISATTLMLPALLGIPNVVGATEPAPDRAAAEYEVRFMSKMVDHHMMAVMMGDVCMERAVHPELITMCQDIVANQAAEIETMQAWLQDWYGIAYVPDMNSNSMSHLMGLYGEDFEITFMRTMIRHHSRAVREGTRCVERAYHPELISMCTDIVGAQLEEIQTLRTWLCQWHGMCRAWTAGIS